MADTAVLPFAARRSAPSALTSRWGNERLMEPARLWRRRALPVGLPLCWRSGYGRGVPGTVPGMLAYDRSGP